MKILKSKKLEELSTEKFLLLLQGREQTIVDIGCGDGKFILNQAKSNPQNLYIGIDSSTALLESTVKKLQKAKTNNVLYIIENIAQLPTNLYSIADEIYINFPWGSLLQGIIKVDTDIIKNIVHLAKNDTEMKIYVSYDEKFERTYKDKRDLPELSFDFLKDSWKPQIEEYDLHIESIATLSKGEKNKIHTSWGKELLDKRDREVFVITVRIQKDEGEQEIDPEGI